MYAGLVALWPICEPSSIHLAAIDADVMLPGEWSIAEDAGPRGCAFQRPDGTRVEVVAWQLSSPSRDPARVAWEHVVLLRRACQFQPLGQRHVMLPWGGKGVQVKGRTGGQAAGWTGAFVAFLLPDGRGCVIGSFVPVEGGLREAVAVLEAFLRGIQVRWPGVRALVATRPRPPGGMLGTSIVPVYTASAASRVSSPGLPVRLAAILPAVEARAAMLAMAIPARAAQTGLAQARPEMSIVLRPARPISVSSGVGIAGEPTLPRVASQPVGVTGAGPGAGELRVPTRLAYRAGKPPVRAVRPAAAVGRAGVEEAGTKEEALPSGPSLPRVAARARPGTELPRVEGTLRAREAGRSALPSPVAGVVRPAHPATAGGRPQVGESLPAVGAAKVERAAVGGHKAPRQGRGRTARPSRAAVQVASARTRATVAVRAVSVAAGPAPDMRRVARRFAQGRWLAGRPGAVGPMESARVPVAMEPGRPTPTPAVISVPARPALTATATLPPRSAPTAGWASDPESQHLHVPIPLGWNVDVHTVAEPWGEGVYVVGQHSQRATARFSWAQPAAPLYRELSQLLRTMGYREWQTCTDPRSGLKLTVANRRSPKRYLEDLVLSGPHQGLLSWQMLAAQTSDTAGALVDRGEGVLAHVVGATEYGPVEGWYAVATGEVVGMPHFVWAGAWLAAQSKPGSREALEALAYVVRGARADTKALRARLSAAVAAVNALARSAAGGQD